MALTVALLLAVPLLPSFGQVSEVPPAPPPAAPANDPLPPAPATTETLPTPARVPPVAPTNPADEGPPLSGRGALSPFASPVLGHLPFRADYRAIWYPNQEVAGQGTRLGDVQQDLSLNCPIWQDSHNEWAATAHVRSEAFDTGGTVLPATGQPFPSDLWNVHFGTSYRHLFDNGWIGGASVNLGSASDKPFHSINEMTAGVNAFVRVPAWGNDAWLFSLSYAANSQLAIPLPGVAYIWQPSDCFRANLGLPFQIFYRPVDDLTLDFSYMLLTHVHSRATYRLAPRLRLYGGFDWSNEGYFLADRVNVRDRFFYYEMRLTSGVQWMLGPHASIDLASGYAFDRYYFEGRGLTGQTNNRVDVGSTPILSLQFLTRW
jgi:hypothetical protein